MAFITFAFNKGDVPQFNGSGFLIGRDEKFINHRMFLDPSERGLTLRTTIRYFSDFPWGDSAIRKHLLWKTTH